MNKIIMILVSVYTLTSFARIQLAPIESRIDTNSLKLLYPTPAGTLASQVQLEPSTNVSYRIAKLMEETSAFSQRLTSIDNKIVEVKESRLVGSNYVDMISEVNRVLDAMELAESEGFVGSLHPDGKSYKWYGITVGAVKELVRVGRMKEFVHPDLMTKEEQRRVAKLYLELMHERYHCTSWLDAAGHYHNSSGPETKNESRANHEERRIYRNKVNKFMK